MKKILLLVIAVFSFIACTNEVSEKGTKSSNPCDFVGKYHNAALKYTFGHLKNATRTEISLEGQEELLFDDLTSYLSDVLSTESSFDISCYCQVDDEEEIEYAINDAMLRIGGNNLIPYSDQGLAVNSLIDSLDVSESVRTEFRDIYFGFIVYSGANLLSFIQNKENSIMLSNYTNMEKSFLLAVLAVGENSFEYWNSPGFDSGVSGKNIAKADVVGAIRGAWNGRKVIALCSLLGGVAGGTQAILRYAFVQAVIDSAVYYFIESDEIEVPSIIFPDSTAIFLP